MSLFPVAEFLQRLKGKRVYFDALYGNHGDRLLSLATQSMLDRADLTPARRPAAADFILINGGGSMAEGWFGLERLAGYCRDFPEVPLAVLPSSYFLPSRSIADVIGKRRAPLWLWARERPSLALLQNAGLDDGIHLGLDHDLAFSLKQHALVQELRNEQAGNSVLIVERDDWEGPTGRVRPFSPKGFDFVPEGLRTLVRRALVGPIRRRQDRTSVFAAAALRFAHQRHPETAGARPFIADISLPETCGFRAFLAHIAESAVIVTTRLHVAILGHILQRRTYLVDGSYHKFRGVFEFSMQDGPTEMLVWDGTELKTGSATCSTSQAKMT